MPGSGSAPIAASSNKKLVTLMVRVTICPGLRPSIADAAMPTVALTITVIIALVLGLSYGAILLPFRALL